MECNPMKLETGIEESKKKLDDSKKSL